MLGKASMCSGFHFIKILLGPCRTMVGKKKSAQETVTLLGGYSKEDWYLKTVTTKDIRGAKIRFKKHLEDKISTISNDWLEE